jgi:hypothetical protein
VLLLLLLPFSDCRAPCCCLRLLPRGCQVQVQGGGQAVRAGAASSTWPLLLQLGGVTGTLATLAVTSALPIAKAILSLLARCPCPFPRSCLRLSRSKPGAIALALTLLHLGICP